MSAQPRDDVPLVVTLADARAHGLELVGGKAFTLSELLDAGFRVPDGHVVTTGAHEVWLDTGTVAELDLDLDGAYAFRSSAVGEDGAQASFAGQFVSVLNVEHGDEADALRTCWGSAHGEAVDEYEHAIGQEGGAIAVLVQRMVDADFAGVAFTANPITGADEVVIECVAGLADHLLEGEQTPERWTVGSTPTCLSSAEVLTSELAEEIAGVCREIEVLLGAPQDIEWAFADGELFILQSRPITALPIEPTERPPANQTWELQQTHFHGPVLPLLASSWLPIHARCFEQVAARSGMPFDTIRSKVFGGRVYARLEPLGDGGTGRDDRKPPPKWVFALLMRLVPAFRKRIAAAKQAVSEDLPMKLIDEWEAGGRDASRARTIQLLEVDLQQLSDAALADHLDDILEHMERGGLEHFMLAVVSSASTIGALGRLVEQHTDFGVNDVLDLVSGYSAASTASGDALDALADEIADDERALELLQRDPHSLASCESPGGKAFARFIADRGHRIYGYAVDEPMWAENPLPVARLLRARLKGKAERSDPEQVAQAAEARLRDMLKGTEHWPRVEQLLQRARRARPYQDDTEDLCFETFGVLRYAALEAGRRFEDRGHFRADDIWFCTVEEILDGLRTGHLDTEAERRHGEYRWAQGNNLGTVLGPEPGPPPDIAFPKSVDEFLGGMFWFLVADARPHTPDPDADLAGLGCSPGEASGPVKVIMAAEDIDRIEPGDILVCPCTTASWSVAFPLVAGLITEVGGPLSHPATLAREYGIPGVLGVEKATSALRDGELVRIDGSTGSIWRR